MKSKRTWGFQKLYDELPLGIQKLADKAYERFEEDPDHPSLNFKPVGSNWYSARIGIHYRAVCFIDNGSYIWFWIGIHSDYENLLKNR